jgi:hypothetical protein
MAEVLALMTGECGIAGLLRGSRYMNEIPPPAEGLLPLA